MKHIRAKINALQARSDIAKKETAERILRLMDIHERVKSARADVFDLKSIRTFITQLMIPLLGFLLANLDTVTRWLSPVK